MIISPRLMNYVMIPYEWKRFIYHVGRARDQCYIAETGLVAGKKEDEQFSSLFLIRSTAMHMRQNLLKTLRNQEKYNIKFIGDLNKMQCTGFICPQHNMLV